MKRWPLIFTLVVVLVVISILPACKNAGKPAGSQNNTTEPGAAEHGKALFEQYCAGCHGMDGAANSNAAANLQQITIDNAGIIETIQNGKGIMPPFKGTLTDPDMSVLAAYVKTLHR